MIHYITTNGIGNPWVAAELVGMDGENVPVVLHSMRDPGSHFFDSEWARRMNRDTRIIYPVSIGQFLVSSLVAPYRYGSRFWACLGNALTGYRETRRGRLASIMHVFIAAHWVRSLDVRDVRHIHSQWIHSCGTIGMYGAWLLDVSFSFTGHAVDLFRDRVALEDKIKRAKFIVCISNFHREFYLKHGAREEQLITVHCGIDVDNFECRLRTAQRTPPHIVSLGRLVEKKGNTYLIDACRILRDRGIEVQCTIAGDGPLTNTLQRQVREESLEDVVTVTGKAVLQEDLADFLQSGDIYVQPCVWSSDNDVDGTPRTLMEAMACGLPSISTRIAGIPDIIEDGVSGLLVEPNDAESLADAIERVIKDSTLAGTLSESGRRKIERDFKLPECLEPLKAKFRELICESQAGIDQIVRSRGMDEHAYGSEMVAGRK